MLPALNYRSINDMNQTILRNLHKFPHDIDLVVGIPRSGMLPANLIALYLQKPYTDIDSFINGKIYESGERGQHYKTDRLKKILIVDDSICSGKALNKTKQKLTDLPQKDNFSILFAAVFATEESRDKVDIFCEIVPWPRVFQWNIFHHISFIPQSFCDIDGVLCPNPPIDDDGEQYINYIKNAPQLYIPSIEIDTIISCRLEKYRDITETWLKEKNIKYKHLILLNKPNKEARKKWGKHGEYKGHLYKKSECTLFIESSLWEAKIIQKISNKPVFCTETFEMLNTSATKQRFFQNLESIKVFIWKILCFLHIMKEH